MCSQCDVAALLAGAGLEPTDHRRRVLQVVLRAETALTPREIMRRLQGGGGEEPAMNKVTLYRILDLLVDSRLLDRHPALDRTFRYCPAAIPGHPRHHHFYCTACGGMQCLAPESVRLEVSGLGQASVERLEVRLDGVCDACRSRSATS